MQYTLFVIIAPLSAIACGSIAIYAWRARNISGSRHLAQYAAIAFTYLLLNLLELLLRSETGTLWMAKLEYIFITLLPVVWFTFALEYSGKQHWFPTKARWILFVMPVLTVSLVMTNEYHHLIWESTTYEWVGTRLQYLYLHVQHGDFFYANYVFIYGLFITSVILITATYIRYRNIYRKQTIWLVIGAFIPLIANAIYVFHLIPGLQKDYTVASFCVAAIAYAIGIFGYQLFELMPIARTVLVDSIKDGVIVLDNTGRLVDINPAAQNLLDINRNMLGLSLSQALTNHPELLTGMQATLPAGEVCLKTKTESCYFEIHTTPLYGKRNNHLGQLVTLHDVTERVLLFQQVEKLAADDSLTGLFNRRHFIEMAENEIQRAYRYKHTFSIMLIDIDKFKQINDTWGHSTGDRVLLEFANILRQTTRKVDILARFAGDEFIILLPEISRESSLLVAQRIQKKVQNLVVHEKTWDTPVTVSIGIAWLDLDQNLTLDTLFERADKALYYAKNHGRNKTTFWVELPLNEYDTILV